MISQAELKAAYLEGYAEMRSQFHLADIGEEAWEASETKRQSMPRTMTATDVRNLVADATRLGWLPTPATEEGT